MTCGTYYAIAVLAQLTSRLIFLGLCVPPYILTINMTTKMKACLGPGNLAPEGPLDSRDKASKDMMERLGVSQDVIQFSIFCTRR